jgi:diguanylate cyclase (GGDEF)-like protein
MGLAALSTVAALWRPLRVAVAPELRLGVLLTLGLGLAVTAFVSSLRGRSRLPRLAFLAFLVLGIDALAQVIAPRDWPIWPVMALVVAAMAVAEPLRVALGGVALATLLGRAVALVRGGLGWGFKTPLILALGYGGLAVAVDRALVHEKRRLAATLAELARLTHGIGQLEVGEATARGLGYNTAALTLRGVSDDARRARQAERAQEVDSGLARLVRLARRAARAHSIVYFEIDRERGRAYARASDGPESLVADAIQPLDQDPLAFVLEREQAFYVTDFKRLLWSLPYYRGEVKIGSLLALPVRVGSQVSGVLVADALEAEVLDAGERDLLGAFAEIAGQTILDAKAALGREELGAEFKAVYEVSRRLATLIDATPAQRLLLHSARDLVALESAAVVMADEAETRYRVVEAEGWAAAYVDREVGLSERTWTSWVLRSAEEPYLLDDVSAGRERMPVLVLDEGAGRNESLLAVPLRVRNRALGALILTSRPGGFDASTRRVLGILANQAAAALYTMRLVERAKDQALRDGLTGLYNRRAFDDLLSKSLAREQRQGGRLGLVLVDLDLFKKLNDTHGHPAGDAALKATAQILVKHLRKGDHAARYGGEEFVLVLPGADESGTAQIAERIRQAVQHQRLHFEGARIAMTASLGVAVAPTDGDSEETILAAADRALYAAKHRGRNRVVLSSSVAPAGSVISS